MATIISNNITSPLGLTTEQTYKAVREGKSGLSHYPCENGEGGWNDLPFPIEASLFSKEQWDKIMVDGFSKFESLVLHSVKAAISTLIFNKERAILILSSTKGDIELLEKGEEMPSLADAAKKVSLAIGIENDPIVVCNACISGVSAIILGQRLVDCGNFTHVIVCGADVQSRFIVSGFQSLKALSDEPCRPFDKDRAGLNLGEGAAYLVMETAASASKRGVKPMCQLSGYGNACDAFHQTASSPEGEGAWLAMQEALRMAGLQPGEIQYVNAHGTGTPNNDESESHALRRIFGEDLPPVSSTKSFTGHTTSASGSIEAVICMLALEHQFMPPQINWHTPMDDGIVPVTDSTPKQEIRHILSNAFGFGGNDSSLVISKYED